MAQVVSDGMTGPQNELAVEQSLPTRPELAISELAL